MAQFDLPLDELRSYRPERHEPADFDAFWRDTLAESRRSTFPPRFDPFDAGLVTVDAFDVTFPGFDGDPIKAWLLLPVARDGRIPCVVEYLGYGRGRGHPVEWLAWASMGYAHLVVDTRGQGGQWSPGDTSDPHAAGGPQHPGFLTRGIDDPKDYYYRRLIADAVLAVEAIVDHPAIDRRRIAVSGASQGGGLALAVAGLSPDAAVLLADVPFLSDIRRAIQITDADPYAELVGYLRIRRTAADSVFQTLDYVDGLNFAARASASALFSVGLMDLICPPSTVFAAFNHYAGEKRISVWPYNGHEGGGTQQTLERAALLRSRWGHRPGPEVLTG
ncbi:MAG: cephalosporin-C deacetylase [Chloroflexota bacterium]|jgi:cephalosporin-C deacetylase|nr:cephalosporin-C deacetylase [Chloroflexota bacterium]